MSLADVLNSAYFQPNYKEISTSTDGRCGPDFGKKSCPGKEICSTDNWCITVGINGGMYDGKDTKGPALPFDNRCGPYFNHKKCPTNKCCSYTGWCGGELGKKDDWCAYPVNDIKYQGKLDGKYDGDTKK